MAILELVVTATITALILFATGAILMTPVAPHHSGQMEGDMHHAALSLSA
jgi:hypothetical protein